MKIKMMNFHWKKINHYIKQNPKPFPIYFSVADFDSFFLFQFCCSSLENTSPLSLFSYKLYAALKTKYRKQPIIKREGNTCYNADSTTNQLTTAPTAITHAAAFGPRPSPAENALFVFALILSIFAQEVR